MNRSFIVHIQAYYGFLEANEMGFFGDACVILVVKHTNLQDILISYIVDGVWFSCICV